MEFFWFCLTTPWRRLSRSKQRARKRVSINQAASPQRFKVSRRSVNQWEARVSALVRRVCFELAAFFFSNEEISRDRRGYFFEGTILYLEPCQTGRLLDVCHPEWSDSITVEDTVCDWFIVEQWFLVWNYYFFLDGNIEN